MLNDIQFKEAQILSTPEKLLPTSPRETILFSQNS
jgi:hypothetical protein